MTSTGKAARRQGGNRYACKRNRARSRSDKKFGSLPYSYREGKGNFASFRAAQVATCRCAAGCPGIAGGDHVPVRRRPEYERRAA